MSVSKARVIGSDVHVVGDIKSTTGNVNDRHTATDGATLDAHVANSSIHTSVDDASTSSTTAAWSASKLNTEFGGKSDTGHTHEASDITDLTTTTVPEGDNKYYTDARADARIAVQSGQPLGLAPLNASGKISTAYLNLDGGVVYQGTWNASTNSPSLSDGSGAQGEYWVVSVTGTTSLDGENDWAIGDWVISNAAGLWEKADHSDAVNSVAGMKGAVTLNTDNVAEGSRQYYTDARFDARLATKTTTNVAEGTDLYYTEARVSANTDVAAATAHVANDALHRQINDSSASSTTTYSGTKVEAELATKAASVHSHTASEISDLTTSTVPEGSSQYYTEARVSANTSVAANTSHRGDATLHRVIDDGAVSTTTNWSSSKIDSTKADIFDEELHAGFFEDFIGDGLSSFFSASYTAGSSVAHVDGAGGLLKLTAAANASDYAELLMSTKQVTVNPDCRLKFRVRVNQTTASRVELGARVDGDEGMYWLFDAGANANWQSFTNLAGTPTTTDSGEAADTSWHVFDIVTASGSVKFYMDGALKATHTTNLPAAIMSLFVKQIAQSAALRHCNVDFIKFTVDRDGTGGGNDAGGDSKCCIM